MPTFAPPAAVLAAFDAHVAATAARIGAPGLVAGIVAGGEVVHHAAAGVPGALAPDPTSVFRIASMTKSFTAAAVLLLRDRGAFRLDDPVADHVPVLTAIRPPTADSPPVTLRHLLTMASGLATDDAWADRHLDATPAELDALFEQGATFAHPPGITMEYSNYGFAMLGRVVETVDGRSCSRFVTEELLTPLGLHSTVWESGALAPGSPVMTGHRLVDGAAVVDRPDPLGDGGFAPMGGLWSNLADLARWVGFLADGFPSRDEPDAGPLRRASRRELQQVHRTYTRPILQHGPDGTLRQIGLGYGMGLQRAHHLQFGDVVAHSGGLPGYGSNMRWLPHRGVGVVALANVTYAPMVTLTHELLELLGDADALPDPPTVTSPHLAAAADALVGLLNDWSDERAAAVCSDNVTLDEPWERRSAHAAEVVRRHGPLRVISVAPLSATEADVRVAGTGQEFTIELQLAPTVPPRVQWYEIVDS